MNRKSQALVIILLVIISLSVLALSLGHRVSIGLRLSSYQRDRLKALYLAKAGINRAISRIISDTSLDYDSLDESWADNERVFRRIAFKDDLAEFASVSYSLIDDNNETQTIYGLVDEERKININTASKELLAVLVEELGIQSEQPDIVDNILIWRGSMPDTNKIYENSGYPCKSEKIRNIEELILVKGINFGDIEKFRKYITVYGDGKININTVPLETLKIIARSMARKQEEWGSADSLAKKIIDRRKEKGHFRNNNDIDINTTGDDELNIFNALKEGAVFNFKSDNFFIAVSGNAGKIKRELEAVYNRKEKNIIYWHET